MEGLAAAVSALEKGQPQLCLALLAAGAAGGAELQRRQLQALCQVALAARDPRPQAWSQVLGLEAGAAQAPDVQRQFKRLAALVHPDKCCLETAEGGRAGGRALAGAAFVQLRAGVDGLLAGLPSGGAGGGSAASTAAWEADDGAWVGSGDNGGFPWWGQWEAEPEGGTAQPAADPVAADEASADERALQGLTLEALQAEVRARQDAALSRPRDASGALVPAALLQARLRRARSQLAARNAAAAAADSARGGGFL